MFDAFDDDQIDAVAEVDVSSMSRPTKRARTAPQDANTDSSSSSSSSSTTSTSTTASVSSTLTTKLATDTDYTDSTDSTLATTTTRKPLPIIVVLDDGTTEREDGKACKHEVALAPGMTHEQFEAQRKAGRPDVPPTPGK